MISDRMINDKWLRYKNLYDPHNLDPDGIQIQFKALNPSTMNEDPLRILCEDSRNPLIVLFHRISYDQNSFRIFYLKLNTKCTWQNWSHDVRYTDTIKEFLRASQRKSDEDPQCAENNVRYTKKTMGWNFFF